MAILKNETPSTNRLSKMERFNPLAVLLSTRDSIQPRSRSNATEGTIRGEGGGGEKTARGMRPFSLSLSLVPFSRDRACVFLARIIPGNLEPGRPREIPRLDKS